MLLYQILSDYIHKNYKKSHPSNRFKTSVQKKEDALDLSGGSYSLSEIQDSFEYIVKTLNIE